MTKKLIIFVLFSLLLNYYCFAQLVISGTITNSNSEKIENANILAIPQNPKGKMVFSTSNKKGNYKITLPSNSHYKLIFSHISFINYTREVKTGKENTTLDIILQDNLNQLEEITLNNKAPVEIKKDTITYNVDAFINGKERKLREVLKKLPGLEVNKNGAVTIYGKKITRLLVENKTFFNGDTKLGVNNIPADVVNEVEVIDDYHETEFLKGLETSEDIAMNIKLKEDKKKFVFGDVDIGLGIENQYKIHPKIFKYSPRLSLNFISDLNNSYKKSFTLSDYVDFEGGLNQKNKSEIFSSNILNILRNNNFISNTHSFFGINAHYNPNDKLEIRSFILGLNDKNDYLRTNKLNYFIDNIFEERSLKENSTIGMLLAKQFLNYSINDGTIFRAEISTESNNVNTFQNNSSSFLVENSNFTKTKRSNLIRIKSKVSFDKKFNKNHVSAFKSSFKIDNMDDHSLYNSKINIFSDTIPIVEDTSYRINQDQNSNLNFLTTFMKHYWVINRKNHLYLNVRNNYSWNRFKSEDYQILTSNGKVPFQGFNNNLYSQYNYFSPQIEYKRIISDFVFELKLNYENHHLKNTQSINPTLTNANRLFPEFKLTWDINEKKEVVFNYTNDYYFPNFSRYAEGNLINGFNTVFIGNQNLRLEQNEAISLFYSSIKTYGLSFYSSIRYNKRSNIITNSFLFSEIYSIVSPTQLDVANQSFSSRFKLTYNKPFWNIKYGIRYNHTSLNNVINNSRVSPKLNTFSNDLEFKTKYESYPNIELNANYTFNFNENNNIENRQQSFSIDTNVNYNYKDWKFDINYGFTLFKNKANFNTNSFFDLLNTTIFYNKEDSPWSFEVDGYNLTNNNSRLFSYFSSTNIDEKQIFVFPRTILFSIIYKL
ncbi:carboxypeptidase-like regulatory domain-containing protein [Gelatiniphilus marinus]|uniref:Carboxypeptidase-like regulatory domain-containing protein n=1 Tax=Gelatiniphilus marinus TaxID=1759464 RepID=A0ABW5JSB8_9FLAO